MTHPNETIERAARIVGQVLRDKWRLDALIGVGGMASVYAATHRNGKRAAIKILHRDIADGDSQKSRFLREGYVANKVGHAGVVNVLDDDTTEDGRPYLVMELLEGESLKTRWSRWRRRMPLDEVVRITHALLDVLAAAHEKGIVHRDIKPDNIFLTNDGAVKVLDFGIARLREGGDLADATRSTAMLGTPAFMAPEQARSRWEWVDARTDLWAVGALMFNTITGYFVHDGGTVTEIIVAAATTRAKPVRSVMPEVPEAVAAIIDRALAFEQTERWQNAREMQTALDVVMRGGLVMAAAPPPSSQSPSQPLTDPRLMFAPPASAPLSAPLSAPASAPAFGPAPALPAPPRPGGTQPLQQVQAPLEPTVSSSPASTSVATGAASVTVQDTQAAPQRPRTNALVIAILGAIVGVGLTLVIVLFRFGGKDAPAETVAGPSNATPAAPPSVEPKQPAPTGAPAAEAPIVTVAPIPTPSASAAPATTPRTAPQPRGGSKPATTSKRDPFDKF